MNHLIRMAMKMNRYINRYIRHYPWRFAAADPNTPLGAAQAHFEAIYPELKRLAHSRLRRMGVMDPDRREEHVTNAIDLTWYRYVTAMEKGTAHPDLIRPMLAFSLKQTLAGRQLPGLITPNIGAPSPSEVSGHEVLPPSESPDEPTHAHTPDRIAAATDATDSFLATLKPHHRAIAEALMRNENPSDIAARHGMSRPAFSNLRRALKDKYDEHMEGQAGAVGFRNPVNRLPVE